MLRQASVHGGLCTAHGRRRRLPLQPAVTNFSRRPALCAQGAQGQGVMAFRQPLVFLIGEERTVNERKNERMGIRLRILIY